MSGTSATQNSSIHNKHFGSANSKHSPRIDITKEEFNAIESAFKKEEFRKLFFDYCKEIQDPENRKIYEDEIKQFEAERGVDVRFINPEPGFVVKTSVDGDQKCFVNIAKSAEVAKPSNEVYVNKETGSKGLNWAIPMAQGTPRDDVDANGKRCRVFDVIYHPDALYLAQRDAAFRKCLIDTALDAVEREFKVQLDRTNLKFPKLQFKGIARPTVIRKLSKNPPPEASEPHPLDSVSPARPTADSSAPKMIPLKTELTPKPEFSTPKYIIKYRRGIDLAECTNELDAKLNVTRPLELVIDIELPLLKSTAECQLDVTTRSLYLLSERAGAKYLLNIDLPYPVDDKNGNARFDTDKRRLCITLPVVQVSVEKQRAMHDTLQQLNREDSGVESDVREDMHSNSNSESPVEELSDSIEDHTTETTKKNEESSASQTLATPTAVLATPIPFLKSTIHYQFPAKFDCNVLDNVMSLVLHVRNVQSESIAILKHSKNLHLQFISIGSGYYPTHYAFYLQFPNDCNIEIASAEAEAWENNVVLNLNLEACSENLSSYFAGLDSGDIKQYTVQGKFQLTHKSRQRKKSPPTPPISLSSSLAISVERSECERSVEIEIKPREQQSTCTANTTEDEDCQQGDEETHVHKKMNKKQRKKNKKRRSLSESACDDIKAYHHQQQQQQQQHQHHQQKPLLKDSATANAESGDNSSNSLDDNSSPERRLALNKQNISSQSMAVPTGSNISQQRKQRSYSECRGDSVISSSDGSILPPSFKGILKRYSRYEPRPSISDSCSSIDECSSYSCSMDTGVGHSLPFSQSFSDIPEENVTGTLSESCKKTVRFNEVIKKQVFRLDSSILGQRKKNQKRRDRKQRALQRRLSEGDSADYEDNNKPVILHSNTQYFKKQNETIKKPPLETPHGDVNSSFSTVTASGKAKLKENHTRKVNLSKVTRQRLESESSSDIDVHKNAMMFEMDM